MGKIQKREPGLRSSLSPVEADVDTPQAIEMPAGVVLIVLKSDCHLTKTNL